MSQDKFPVFQWTVNPGNCEFRQTYEVKEQRNKVTLGIYFKLFQAEHIQNTLLNDFMIVHVLLTRSPK